MNKFFKELPFWVLILLPYVYLAIIWNQLPERVPTHFGITGEADDWSDKNSMLFIPGAMGLGIYLLMLIIPIIDPKKKIQEMGGKYYSLRLILSIFISLLSTYLLYVSKIGNIQHSNMLFVIIGGMFAMIGNYIQVTRPNYFVGIRTPWTLESPEVWKSTHRLAGKLWMVCGIAMVLFSFIFVDGLFFAITFCTLLGIMVIVPVVYSYLEFRKEQNLPK